MGGLGDCDIREADGLLFSVRRRGFTIVAHGVLWFSSLVEWVVDH